MDILNITKVYVLDDINNLEPDAIENAGFELVTFDLDKTIVGQTDEKLPDDRLVLFEKFGKTAIHVAIASNAFGIRVERVRDFARQISEAMSRECPSVVPDDVAGMKKPRSDMLRYALAQSGIDSPYGAMHIGDQVRSDVVAAEGAGFRAAVLVRPMGEGDDPIVKYIGRPIIEPWLRRNRGLPNAAEFPSKLADFY